jgi:hypothetical protein
MERWQCRRAYLTIKITQDGCADKSDDCRIYRARKVRKNAGCKHLVKVVIPLPVAVQDAEVEVFLKHALQCKGLYFPAHCKMLP